MESIVYPIVSVCIIYIVFIVLLKNRIKKNIFCELGFLYISLVVLYTILPGFVLIYGLSKPGDPISLLLEQMMIESKDLTVHFWRLLLFIISFIIGYLLSRGKETILSVEISMNRHTTISTLFIIIVIIMLFLSSMSGPVESYIDNYTRYDHLSFPLRKLASIFIRFKTGFYTILLTLLFVDYKYFKKYIAFIVIILSLYELVYSHGSRIYMFILILQTFFLYNYYVKKINFKKLIPYTIAIMVLFSSIEVIRLLDSRNEISQGVLKEEGIKPPGELGAIFVPSFHLYAERNNGSLPNVEWQMLFYDLISPFTFNSFTKWNPMYWYRDNYFPDSVVPPFTLGPVADSAIWGGEIDLLFRGIINGIFFAFIVKWFLKRRSKWWAITVYTYCFSYSVITLKYSVFFYLTPLVKELVPTIIIVLILMRIFSSSKNSISTLNIIPTT